MNFDRECGQQQRLRGWSRMVVKLFQDGGRPPLWKSIYRHISAKNHPIFMKFCTQQQILNWVNVTWSKMKKMHWTDSEFDRTYFLFSFTFLFIPCDRLSWLPVSFSTLNTHYRIVSYRIVGLSITAILIFHIHIKIYHGWNNLEVHSKSSAYHFAKFDTSHMTSY